MMVDALMSSPLSRARDLINSNLRSPCIIYRSNNLSDDGIIETETCAKFFVFFTDKPYADKAYPYFFPKIEFSSAEPSKLLTQPNKGVVGPFRGPIVGPYSRTLYNSSPPN